MDKLKNLFSQISLEEKNSILFDRVGNFTFNDFKRRVNSYSNSLINSFILSYDSGPFLELLLLLQEEKTENKNKKFSSDSFKIVHPSKKMPKLEYREGQHLMEERIKTLLCEEKNILLAQAPPGIGKTLAYIIPMVENIENKRFLISTNTKSLQEQIFTKDIELASYFSKKIFSVLSIKGISNYFCFAKYYENMNNFHPLMKLATEGFIQMSNTGDVNSLKFLKGISYDDITCDAEYCQDKNCPFSNICFYIKVKEKALSSSIVITNHYLTLIDHTLPKSIMGNFDMIVFDEAHNLEKVISDIFSYTLDFFEIFKLLKYFEKKIKEHLKNLKDYSLSPEAVNFFEQIGSYIASVYENFETIYQNLLDRLSTSKKDRDVYSNSFFENLSLFFLKNKQYIFTITEYCEKLLKMLNEEKFKNLEVKQTFKYISDKFSKLFDILIVVFEAQNDDYSFFYDFNRETKNIILNAYLVNTGDQFAGFLKKKEKSSMVFTSATLKSYNDFKFFKERIGLDKSKRKYFEDSYESSFDYKNQMKIFCIDNMGDPNSQNFLENVSIFLENIEKKMKKTLVLTTSYQQIDFLKKKFEGSKKYVFQEKDGNSEKYLLEYKNKKNGILVGTSTFWEGIDLPGDLLEILIILKIPFIVPDDPVYLKRSENLKNLDMDPFYDYSLPSAILKLKQGIGRLIRKKDDQGEIFILDERILKKKYGKIIIEEFYVKPEIFDFYNFIGILK